MRPMTDPLRKSLITAIRVDVLSEARQLADDMSDSLGNLHRLDYLDALDHLIRNAHQDAAEQHWVRVRPDEQLVLIGEWACAKVDGCTCYGPGPGQPHEPRCGFEPIIKVSTQEHDAVLTAELRRALDMEN